MTVVLDRKGAPITVGARVRDWQHGTEVGTVAAVTEPDGDVNEYGRPVPLGPFVVVHYDDGCEETWTARWNATGPWDDDRDDYTCDDVEIAPAPEPITETTRLGWFR